jgi:hypothetical protein
LKLGHLLATEKGFDLGDYVGYGNHKKAYNLGHCSLQSGIKFGNMLRTAGGFKSALADNNVSGNIKWFTQ